LLERHGSCLVLGHADGCTEARIGHPAPQAAAPQTASAETLRL